MDLSARTVRQLVSPAHGVGTKHGASDFGISSSPQPWGKLEARGVHRELASQERAPLCYGHEALPLENSRGSAARGSTLPVATGAQAAQTL